MRKKGKIFLDDLEDRETEKEDTLVSFTTGRTNKKSLLESASLRGRLKGENDIFQT